MNTKNLIDADIIDYPELANIYGGIAILDAVGNGYLAVPITTPEEAERPGRRSLTEVQQLLRNALCAWGLRAFHTARAAGMSPEQAQAKLEACKTIFSAASVRAKGPPACRAVFGITPARLSDELQRIVGDAMTRGGEQAVEQVVDAAFATFTNLAHAFARSRGYDGRLYEAFYGRASGAFHDKMADAVNPQPSEAHLSLPIATQLSYLSGVNLSFLWQDQWLYRLVLGTAAALHPWTRNEAVELLPEQLYTLLRCVETAAPNDPTEHGLVKAFLASMADQHQGHDHFLHHARDILHADGLLPDAPSTVTELVRRSARIVADDGEPASFVILPR
jgi:hypothetical protein